MFGRKLALGALRREASSHLRSRGVTVATNPDLTRSRSPRQPDPQGAKRQFPL